MGKSLKLTQLSLRPDASNGLWLCVLIPLAYMTNTWKHKPHVQFQGRVSTIVAFGLFLQTLLVLFQMRTHSKGLSSKIVSPLPAAFTSFLIWICLNQGVLFSSCCGALPILLYGWLYVYVIKVLPRSFTLGEASIVSQGFVLFLINSGLRLFGSHGTDDISLILQVGLIGVTFIVAMAHFVNAFKTDLWFYILVVASSLWVILFPVDGSVAVIILFNFVFGDYQRLIASSVAVVLLGITVVTVIWFLTTRRQSNTRTRKLFHILIVAVFLPGIIYQCKLLFLTTVLLLAIFVLLETVRVLELKYISNALDQTVELFADEKDAGLVALTPIYLLVGCSLPLWLHPCPWCALNGNKTDLLPLVSGVLSVGIGDTVASFIGSKFGRHMWLNGAKSIEGTLASIFVQGLVVITLTYLRYLYITSTQIWIAIIAIVVNSLIEANTNQVDNLVLPLVTFIILSLG